MSHACVCGGSNENCRYCGGRGEIPDRLANALTAHTHLAESRKVHLADKNPKGPPIELTPTRLEKLQALIEKLRQPLVTVLKRAIPSPPLPAVVPSPSQMIGCPRGCGALLDGPESLRRHLQVTHQPPPVGTRLWVSPADSRAGYRVCTLCKARVKAFRMNRHLRNVHGGRPVRPSERPADITTPAQDQDKEKRSSTLIASREKNLDATKLYAQSYREHGRFGSHPSHDGFDDESGPD